MPASNRVPNVHKIAVLRANALGDFVFAVPALEALRAAYPRAEIVYLGAPWHAAFLPGRPSPIDRVVTVPICTGVYQPSGAAEDKAALEAFFVAMRKEHFDLALQLHGGGRYSNPFILQLGARVTAGFKAPDAPALDRSVSYLYFQREVVRYLEAVALVGATPVTIDPRLAVLPRDRAESLRALPATGRPLVLIHPGAGDGRRRWSPTKFAEVGDALAARGAEVVVNGIQGEEAVATATLRAMRVNARMFSGRPSLGCFLGLLDRCRLVISNDSGPLHLARAVGTPTVGIYWCGNIVNAGPMTCHRHRFHLSWRLHCPECGQSCITDDCGHQAPMVDDIAPADVAASALELFEAEDPGDGMTSDVAEGA
jgi:ADP-heptose:LPS heptosyltransferase